jgi:hypothetical protein
VFSSLVLVPVPALVPEDDVFVCGGMKVECFKE